VHILHALENLVDDILLVDVFKDVRPNDCVQIRVHKVEDEINVSVIFSSNNILQSNDVLMAGQLLQKDDFAESSLGVSGVLKGVKVFLESDDFFCSLVNGLPNDTVGSLACKTQKLNHGMGFQKSSQQTNYSPRQIQII